MKPPLRFPFLLLGLLGLAALSQLPRWLAPSLASPPPVARAAAPDGSPAFASVSAPITTPAATASAHTTSNDAFREWLHRFQSTGASDQAPLLDEGRALAIARRERMARLIRENPALAVRDGLRLHEYAALPADLRPLVDRPFSAAVAYRAYPVCGAPAGAPDHVASLDLANERVSVFAYGARAGLMSKKSLPAQGVTLDGAAALDEHALRELEPEELAAARALFPAARPDPTRSFLTGAPIAGEPLVALGGGRLYTLADRAELESINLTLAALDALPGPDAGSDALYSAAPAPSSSAGGPSGFDLAAALATEQAQASAWTEQPKRVFIIRVDFSDRPGASHSQADTATVLNGVVAAQIRAMSYGKTNILAGVSANAYRMPQTSAYYVNGTTGSSFNDELLRDARNTFRAARSGDDAAINLGPTSATGTGSGGGLGDYDIVGVLFVSMNMRSTIAYGGLAGGGDLWMQGNISSSTFTHEFGHNYGIGHSSFWQTSDGSVTGAGGSVEYGDIYDIMGDGDLPDGHFHPQAKSRLNWLAASDWSDATALGSATYRLYRIDGASTTGTPRGVRVTRSAAAGAQEYLWLGYRPSYVGRPFLERGAYLVWQRPGQTRGWLLDTNPATGGDLSDAPVGLGRTYADAASGAFITPLATGGAGQEAYLDVRVNFGPFPGNVAPTVGSISGPATVPARSTPTYTLGSASDANGDSLAYAWAVGDGDVLPNQPSATPAWIVGGTYNLAVTVSDQKGGVATATRSITVTDPIDTWTTDDAGTTADLDRLLHARGRYLAAEYWGELHLSWDGVSWTSVGQPPDIDQPRLAAGPAVFVAAGLLESDNTRGQLCWSPDGRRWRAATFPAGIPALREVAYAAGRFLAVGDDGVTLGSTDGVTWTLATVAGAPDFRRLARTESTWIAVSLLPANNRPETVWTSTDGVAWTQRGNLGVDTHSMFARGGVCYALGWYAGVMYSLDQGQTWLDAALPAGTRWTTELIAAAPDGTLLCTGTAMDESGLPGALLVSTDGRRWVRASGNGALADANALVFGDGRFYAVDDGGVTLRGATFYPTNTAPAASFTTAPATAPARQPVLLAAAATDAEGDSLTYAWDFGPESDGLDGAQIAPTFDFGGPYTVTLRVSDGRGGLTVLTHAINLSDPARTFTDRSVSSTLGNFQSVAAGGGRVVAVGSLFNGAFAGPRAWSADGVTWNTGNVGPNRHLYALVHDGAKFVGSGTRYDFAAPAGYRGWIATSPDGVTWTDRYFTGPWLRAIAQGGGVYVAVGDSGSVIRSTDGLTWNAVAIPGVTTAMSLRGLAWNGSVFLLTGFTNNNGDVQVFASTNGLDWINQSAGAGVDTWQDLRGAAWLNDRFVASGWYSGLCVSLDSGANFVRVRTDYEETPALAHGAGIYFAAGVNRSASSADIDILSRDGANWFAFPSPTTNDRRAAVFFNNTFITVGDNGSIWQSGALAAPTGFVAWQTTNFPAGGLSALTTADPDRDGLANLLEYALDLAPNTAGPAPVNARLAGGLPVLGVSLPEPARADVTYRVEGRPDLATGAWTELARKTGATAWTWQAGGAARLTVGATVGGLTPVEVGRPDDQAGQPRYFLRLVVESP